MVGEGVLQIETVAGGFTATEAVGFVAAVEVTTYYAPNAGR